MLNEIKSKITSLVNSVLTREITKATLTVEYGLRQRAQREALDYIEENMKSAQFCADRKAIYQVAIKAAPELGSVLEFGVYRGYSINLIAEMTGRTVHGFDSFEGLPEGWSGTSLSAGHFSLGGRLPKVRSNVVLHKGWFEDTLRNPETFASPVVAFLHIDCDLYSSTKCVLEGLADYIKSGTVIVFDEYFNYIGWREHEFMAFQEFLDRFNLKYEYIAYSGKSQVAVKIV